MGLSLFQAFLQWNSFSHSPLLASLVVALPINFLEFLAIVDLVSPSSKSAVEEERLKGAGRREILPLAGITVCRTGLCYGEGLAYFTITLTHLLPEPQEILDPHCENLQVPGEKVHGTMSPPHRTATSKHPSFSR